MLTLGGLKWFSKKNITQKWHDFHSKKRDKKKGTQEETKKICEKPHAHKHLKEKVAT